MRIHRCRGAKLPYMLYDGGHINTPEIVCAALILEMVRFRCPSTPSRLTTLSIYDRKAEDPTEPCSLKLGLILVFFLVPSSSLL